MESLGALGHYGGWLGAIVFYIALILSIRDTTNNIHDGLGDWVAGFALGVFPITALTILYIKVHTDYKQSLKELWAREGATTEQEYQANKQRREELERRRKQEDALRRERDHWGSSWEWKIATEGHLQGLSNSLLYLFDGMPAVQVHLIDEPITDRIKYNMFMPGVVFEREDSLARGGSGHVYIKKVYYESATPQSVTEVMKHEMVHCWVDWKGLQDSDPHGPIFQQKAREVGI